MPSGSGALCLGFSHALHGKIRALMQRRHSNCAVARRPTATFDPRLTLPGRSRSRRTLAWSAVIPHRRCRSHNRAERAPAGVAACMAERWRHAPTSASWFKSRSTSSDASPDDPNTRPRTPPTLRRLCSIGPSCPESESKIMLATLFRFIFVKLAPRLRDSIVYLLVVERAHAYRTSLIVEPIFLL